MPHSLQVGAPSCALLIEFELGLAGLIAGGMVIAVTPRGGAIAVPIAPASTGAEPFSFK